MAKHISHESRIQNLDYAQSWKYLSEKEKNYAYYMSKASWAGALVTLHQISYESPLIWCIFQAYFADKNFDELEASAMQGVEGLTADDWSKFIAYVGGFYGNLSNYHSFGHMKFIPEVSPEKFWAILGSHPKAGQQDSLVQYVLTNFKSHVEQEVFAYDGPYKQINYPHEGGITAYFSRNMTPDDHSAVSEFLLSAEAIAKGLDILNTRAFKKSEN